MKLKLHLSSPRLSLTAALSTFFLISILSCSKNHANPGNSSSDTAAAGVFLDPGMITASIQNIPFQSFNHIQAIDNGKTFYIAGQSLLGPDTSMIQISFPDTFSVGRVYVNADFLLPTVPPFASPGTPPLDIIYSDQRGIYKETSNDQPLDTLVITAYDKATQRISGTFSATLGGSVTAGGLTLTGGSFDTYYTNNKAQ